NVTIGGAGAGAGNIISFNGADGISDSATQVDFEQNTIHSNGGNGIVAISHSSSIFLNNSIDGNGALGIDVGADGISANDLNDATLPQNFPVLTGASIAANVMTLTGTLNSEAAGAFKIEIFKSPTCNGLNTATSNGEGNTKIGELDVNTI